MIDHISFSVKDYPKSLEFYDKTLEILGYQRMITIDMAEHNVKVAGYTSLKGQSSEVLLEFWKASKKMVG